MILEAIGWFVVGLAAYGTGAFIEHRIGKRPSSNADLARQLDAILAKLNDRSG